MADREKDIDAILDTSPVELAADAPRAPDAIEQVPPRKRRWGLWFAVVLIALAGVAGWLAPTYMGLDGASAAVESRLSANDTAVSGVQAEVAKLSETVTALQAKPEGVNAADLQKLSDDLTGLQTQSDKLSNDFATLANRMTAIERAATTSDNGAVPDAALSGLQAQVDQLKALVEASNTELAARVDALETAPAPAASKPEINGVFSEIAAAIDTGQPFATPLLVVRDASPTADGLEILAAHASGVLTLDALKAGFPDAARTALSDARTAATADGETASRFTAFFRDQLGMRSLAPKDGSDTDAVLSRAEAALTTGDLPGALRELEALPDSAKPAMADWTAGAQARLETLTALAALQAAQGG
ncbi:MAG: mitofilin family membrane protein [Deltaproteobacteria bacterium]